MKQPVQISHEDVQQALRHYLAQGGRGLQDEPGPDPKSPTARTRANLLDRSTKDYVPSNLFDLMV